MNMQSQSCLFSLNVHKCSQLEKSFPTYILIIIILLKYIWLTVIHAHISWRIILINKQQCINITIKQHFIIYHSICTMVTEYLSWVNIQKNINNVSTLYIYSHFFLCTQILFWYRCTACSFTIIYVLRHKSNYPKWIIWTATSKVLSSLKSFGGVF